MRRINDKLLSWASIIEPETLAQAEKTASLPFVQPHLALMADAHLGKGATVGSVIPTAGAVIPAAVGVDIGCGMIAAKTQYHRDDLPLGRLPALRVAIEQAIPLSAGHYNHRVLPTAEPRVKALAELAERSGFNPDSYDHNWRVQLGSLGSGNHFIEVTADETGAVWLFLHSGSRGVGNKIATHHIQVAQRVMERERISVPDRDLAYLTEGTEEFDRYIAELHWAQEFARLNREEMMDRVIACFEQWHDRVETRERVTCHHNYTVPEEHYGQQVWLTRKGAIDASKGTLGLIPGSMGDASYVVVGLGNPESLNSAPHGAGRSYSRTAARKQFSREQLRAAMAGIEYRDTIAFIDEIPAAYKPIDRIMADSADLVEIKHTLRQIVNVKGD